MLTPFFRRADAMLTSPRLPWALAAISGLLLAPAIGLGLIVDDFGIDAVESGRGEGVVSSMTPFDLFRFTSPNGENLRTLVDQGALPWWTSPALRVAFFRPLSSASHWLDYRLFSGSPAAMHAVTIAWASAAVIVATLLYRRLLGRSFAAGLAACFFAFDPGHAVAAGWIATRNSVLAAFFGLSALYAHDLWRRDGRRWAAFVAPLCTALSLASGESGTAALALLFAHAVVFEGPGLKARAAALGPAAAIGLAWAATYRGLGYGTSHSLMYIDPIASPLDYLRRAVVTLPINLGARLGGIPASICAFLAERMYPVVALTSVALVVAVAGALGPARREPAARFFAISAALAAVPIAATMPNDRNLFFVGFACFGLLALVLRSAVERPSVPARGFAGWIVFLNLIVALPSMPMHATSMSLFARLSRDPLERMLLDDAVRSQTVVFLNPPAPFFVAHLLTARMGTSLPTPERLRALIPGVYPSRITRPRADQLAIHVDGGMLPKPGNWPASPEAPAFKMDYVAQHLSSFVRGTDEPVRTGDVFELPGLRVEVVAVTPDGGPTDLVFTFDRPLDDPSMRWFVWRPDAYGYKEIAAPAIGGAITLEPATIRL